MVMLEFIALIMILCLEVFWGWAATVFDKGPTSALVETPPTCCNRL